MPEKSSDPPFLRLALELGPSLLFFLTYWKADMYAAIGVFMVATAIAMGVSYALTRRISPMSIVSAFIVFVFGGLTLYLHDETFFKMKPTIIYGLFAAILGGGLLFGRSFIAILFNQMFNLTPKGWRILTMRWALFFLGMAALNEIVWRTQTEDFWVNFKVFGIMPITVLFALAQTPLLTRYERKAPQP